MVSSNSSNGEESASKVTCIVGRIHFLRLGDQDLQGLCWVWAGRTLGLLAAPAVPSQVVLSMHGSQHITLILQASR